MKPHLYCLVAALTLNFASAQTPLPIPRCQLIPLPDRQVSFQVDGVEKTRWHFGTESPRPFFYPFLGPSGASLTRIGHPGAENHDHHRSIWFAHDKVNGLSHWNEQTPGRVRQKNWFAYADGNDEAIMASALGWFDAANVEAMSQDVVAASIPLENGEFALELQLTFRPGPKAETVELGKTNFGFLAVRMAKTISAYFGGGTITNSEGAVGEPDIFGKPARWMDYSGPVSVGTGPDRKTAIEGITFFDHPKNPRYPTAWHVREDGWMGAAFCLNEGFTITKEAPLTLRYLLHAHAGPCDPKRAETMQAAFANRQGFEIAKGTAKHHQWQVRRLP